MTIPSDVPPNTVIVERAIGGWKVLPYGQPLEFFKTKPAAVARANQLAVQFLTKWQVIVKPDV